ncbi:DNA mismatch repair protein MutS [Azoarcus indigens]|uniref:DNA-nicking Smr family endonuclease n=1 Tax=Azoarcus indigens TaxID=29545 RepID=A0A4R6DXP5_9RHOO|nr:DNA mismatch repair protein MutS [Azoarcus indigens]TDN50061.1 DNA-nicking Smr family endonuclease [Azoarcus indigens]
MPRRRQVASTPAAAPRPKASDSPFHALAKLKLGQARAGSSPAEPTRPAQAPVPTVAAAPSGDEEALFRQAMQGARPLQKNDRAELERPRPAPVPRAKATTEEADETTQPRQAPLDPLYAAYAEVTPLRDSGRVELGPAPRRATAEAEKQQALRVKTSETASVILPPDHKSMNDAELFRYMTRDTQPVDTRNRAELERTPPLPAPVKREADERAALDESLSTPLSFEDRLDMGDEAAFLRPGLPRRVLSDLRRGRWVLQGEIDLHGYTRDEARAALAQFLAHSLQHGRRCVRVIHGKGLGSPGRVSILKQLSRGWLAQREEILAFCQAGPHDGGSGALLVLMRAQTGTPPRK